jgi:protein-S-isoprenylcysteine O-methyltransferase Ste14
MTEHLILVLWIAWGLYWWATSRGVKRALRLESPASRAGHIVPLVIGAALLLLPSIPGWLGERWLPRTPNVHGVGVSLVAVGLAICVWARIALGRNWSGTVTLKHEHELIQKGPYRRVRHPIYSGLLLAFLGSAVALGEWRGLLAVAIIAIALWRKLRLEERWLGDQFGSRYADYRRTSRALIPWLL